MDIQHSQILRKDPSEPDIQRINSRIMPLKVMKSCRNKALCKYQNVHFDAFESFYTGMTRYVLPIYIYQKRTEIR